MGGLYVLWTIAYQQNLFALMYVWSARGHGYLAVCEAVPIACMHAYILCMHLCRAHSPSHHHHTHTYASCTQHTPSRSFVHLKHMHTPHDTHHHTITIHIRMHHAHNTHRHAHSYTSNTCTLHTTHTITIMITHTHTGHAFGQCGHTISPQANVAAWSSNIWAQPRTTKMKRRMMRGVAAGAGCEQRGT